MKMYYHSKWKCIYCNSKWKCIAIASENVENKNWLLTVLVSHGEKNISDLGCMQMQIKIYRYLPSDNLSPLHLSACTTKLDTFLIKYFNSVTLKSAFLYHTDFISNFDHFLTSFVANLKYICIFSILLSVPVSLKYQPWIQKANLLKNRNCKIRDNFVLKLFQN